MADTIRWYLAPRVTGVDGRRRTHPAISAINGSRGYAQKLDENWSLVQVVTDQFGHAALALQPALIPLPSVKAEWRTAPTALTSRFIGTEISGADEVGVALDKIFLRMAGTTRAAIRRRPPISVYGKIVDDSQAVED